MVRSGGLRDLFDDAPTPHIAHPPRTHHRDYYLATDGSFLAGQGGLGAIAETGSGQRLLRLARVAESADNNAAEYRALRLGLDELAAQAGPDASVGVLVDHNDLAANVNAMSLGLADADWSARSISVPRAGAGYWRDIRRHIREFDDLRAAAIRSDDNPAHVLANAPEDYRHVNAESGGAASRDWEIPPPSRADRHRASD
ncbi:MAG: ribonuclease H [Halobacteriales archaeon]